MKRAKKAALDLMYFERPPIATREQYDLFCEYQKHRHLESDMAEMNFNEYRAMVEDTPVDTAVYEFRNKDNILVAASLTDKVEDGLSGIYKFFTPDRSKNSLGSWIIDWHIEETIRLGLQYVYLGYWIKESSKMAYKSKFIGLEKLTNNTWKDFKNN